MPIVSPSRRGAWQRAFDGLGHRRHHALLEQRDALPADAAAVRYGSSSSTEGLSVTGAVIARSRVTSPA